MKTAEHTRSREELNQLAYAIAVFVELGVGSVSWMTLCMWLLSYTWLCLSSVSSDAASFFAGYSRVPFVWGVVVLWGWSAGYLCLRSSPRLWASVAYLSSLCWLLPFWRVLLKVVFRFLG
jgi:hypothetical protein